MILNGMLYERVGSKWIPNYFELHCDKLIKFNEGDTQINQCKYIKLCCCTLKKIQFHDKNQIKKGFRLKRDDYLAEFSSETEE